MAILSLQNFNTMVQNFASSVQGACRGLVDFSPGSILLAVGEASGSVGLWMQKLILDVLNSTRLATSFGPDADSWAADFVLARLPAVNATGTVTMSRFTTGSPATISPGAMVKTGDGSQAFIVVADNTKAAWQRFPGAYVMLFGTASCDVTVQAINPGIQGNVIAGTISLIASAIPFVDTCNNAANFNNGIDAESDPSFKARFAQYIQTLSKATLAAIGYAISTVQQGLTWTVSENTNAIGAYLPGNFVVTVDDGSGTPSSTLQAAVSAAVSIVRPLCSTWTVRAPTVTTATISLVITTSPTTLEAALLVPVQAAIVAYVNSIPDGSPLVFTRIAGVAYSVDPSIIAVEGVTLNGGSSDLIPTALGAIKTNLGSVTVTGT